MKHIYLFLLFCITFFTVEAQIVNIPDANFKNALVNSICIDTDNDGTLDDDVDANNDGEIQVAEAEVVTELFISNKSIQSLEGIEYFINLFKLFCNNNLLESLDLNNNPIAILDCSNNNNLATILLKNEVVTFISTGVPPPPGGTSSFYNCPINFYLC